MPVESTVVTTTNDERTPALDRRAFVASLTGGVGGFLVPGALGGQQQEAQEIVTTEMIAAAEQVAGLEFTEAQREEMAEGVGRRLEVYEELREVALPNSVLPAARFDPVLPGMTLPAAEQRPMRMSAAPAVTRPENIEEVAFWPVRSLAELVRTGQVLPSELTRMYLDRLRRYGPRLEAVITLTEERALAQARRADQEIAAGRYRGPLHGIPWGAKDLLATRGYRTTWGAKPYEDQRIDLDAAVVERLDEAGDRKSVV